MNKQLLTRYIAAVSFGSALSLLSASLMTANTGAASLKTLLSHRQQTQQPAQPQKTSAEVYKNIQVLKDLPASQMDAVMNFMSAALGVDCKFCHVEGTTADNWPWEKDDNKHKETARKMVVMMRAINENNFAGRLEVNCATCHQGRTHPVALPPLDQEMLRKANAATAVRPTTPNPTVDQILDKYVQAVGGSAAFEKLKNRMVKAQLALADGTTMSQEIYRAAPNKLLAVSHTPSGPVLEAFNGSMAWMKSDQGVSDLSGPALDRVKIVSDFNREIRTKELYTNLAVAGKEKIGDREAYVVRGRSRSGDQERLYFDAQSGLLLRRVVQTRTAFGAILDQSDFDDYREVDGVKLPFTARRTSQWSTWTQKVAEVKHNVSLDETRFDKPLK
jgi:hypothetical protein